MKGSESGMKGADSADKAEPRNKSAQDTNRMQGEKSKSMQLRDRLDDSSKGGKDMKAEGQDSKTGATKAEGRDSKTGNMNAETKGSTDTKSQTTTGNAATSATAAPPAEKRTQIVSAIKSERIQETTNVNFNISVGTVVPTGVRFHPLPPRIVEIYPEWRGYDVILVQRPLRHRPSADPRDRLHHRGLTGFALASLGRAEMPAPFACRARPLRLLVNQ